MRQQESVFCWNRRRARSGEFLREMKEFQMLYRPMIIILLEPKISRSVADGICKKIGKNQWVRADADGFSGEVWCLWNEEEVFVELKYAHSFFLHLAVVKNRGRKWEVTTVYVPPSTSR